MVGTVSIVLFSHVQTTLESLASGNSNSYILERQTPVNAYEIMNMTICKFHGKRVKDRCKQNVA